MMGRISPLDDRYSSIVGCLDEFFSERALVQARVEVECAFLNAIDRTGLFPPLDEGESARIAAARGAMVDEDFARVKAIEHEIRHDVKAVERFLREKLDLGNPERIHFGLTSADVNNLAYGLLLSRYRGMKQLPQVRALIARLTDQAEQWKATVFPARTHGQTASPTTLGKELAVFISRLLRQAEALRTHRFRGKLSGATGNYSAFVAAFPSFDWPRFSAELVSSLGLEPNRATTQIEDHDTLAEYFAIVSRINNIVLDLDLDLWLYISHGDLVNRAVTGEVGSSTMPHKVNPIRFENSEGNLILSNAMLHTLSDKLTHSRMQRDLSDSTVKRSIGTALAYGFLAIDQTLKGLERVDADVEQLQHKVAASPEVLAEAYQSILRAEGARDPYEVLRTAIRGKDVTLESLHRWIDSLDATDRVRARLRALRPDAYVGLAVRVCDDVIAEARSWLATSADTEASVE